MLPWASLPPSSIEPSILIPSGVVKNTSDKLILLIDLDTSNSSVLVYYFNNRLIEIKDINMSVRKEFIIVPQDLSHSDGFFSL